MNEKENLILTSKFFDLPLYLFPDNELGQNRLKGQNRQNIMVVIPKTDQTDVHLEFLSKILAAVNLNIEHDIYLLMLTAGESISFGKQKNVWQINCLFSFGLPPSHLGLQFQLNKYKFIFCNDTRFLFADRLEKLISNKSLKASLWQCLQQLKSE